MIIEHILYLWFDGGEIGLEPCVLFPVLQRHNWNGRVSGQRATGMVGSIELGCDPVQHLIRLV